MKKRHQSGFTLLGMLIILTVIGILIPVAYRIWYAGFIEKQRSHAADQLRQVNAAADACVKRRFETLLASASLVPGP